MRQEEKQSIKDAILAAIIKAVKDIKEDDDVVVSEDTTFESLQMNNDQKFDLTASIEAEEDILPTLFKYKIEKVETVGQLVEAYMDLI